MIGSFAARADSAATATAQAIRKVLYQGTSAGAGPSSRHLAPTLPGKFASFEPIHSSVFISLCPLALTQVAAPFNKLIYLLVLLANHSVGWVVLKPGFRTRNETTRRFGL